MLLEEQGVGGLAPSSDVDVEETLPNVDQAD